MGLWIGRTRSVLFEYVRGRNDWMLKVVAEKVPLGETILDYRKRLEKQSG